MITALVIAFINCNPPPPPLPLRRRSFKYERWAERDGAEAEASKADITLDDTIYTR